MLAKHVNSLVFVKEMCAFFHAMKEGCKKLLVGFRGAASQLFGTKEAGTKPTALSKNTFHPTAINNNDWCFNS